MPSANSILKFAIVAIVAMAFSWTSPILLESIEQCGGLSEIACVDSADDHDCGQTAADLEDSDEPLAVLKRGRHAMQEPIIWRVIPANVSDADWPSVPIPPPLVG